MKKFLAVLGTASALVMGLSSQAGAQTSSNETFTLVVHGSGQNPPGKLIMTGAINAVGVDTTIDDNTDTVKFPHLGVITLTHHDTGTPHETFNEQACVGTFSSPGVFDIKGVSGSLANATGHGTYVAHGTFVATRTSTGCSHDSGTVTFVVHAKGTLNL